MGSLYVCELQRSFSHSRYLPMFMMMCSFFLILQVSCTPFYLRIGGCRQNMYSMEPKVEILLHLNIDFSGRNRIIGTLRGLVGQATMASPAENHIVTVLFHGEFEELFVPIRPWLPCRLSPKHVFSHFVQSTSRSSRARILFN